MNAQVQELETVTIAGAIYTVTNWSGTDVLISKKGTAYMIEPGVSQPHSFPAGTPLRKQGNPIFVLNVGGIIEEVKK
jgi:hypothetical protein